MRTLWLVTGAVVLAMAPWFSATAVVVPLAAAFGIAPQDRGWITGAVQLGFVTGAVGSAVIALADWMEPRKLIRFGMLFAACANALVLATHNSAALLALRFLTGIGLAFVYPPTIRLLTAWYARSRGTAIGIAVGALTIGSFAPHLLSGIELPWRSVMLGASVLGLLGIPLISLVPLPTTLPRAARFDFRAIPRVLREKNVLLADTGYWGHMWELYAVWAWGPVFYAASMRAAGVSISAGVVTFAAFGILGGLSCLVAGAIADRVGRAPVAAMAMIVSGITSCTIGWSFRANPWFVTLLFTIWGCSVVADSAQFSAAVTELADSQYVGTALTLQMGVGFLITMLTIWLVGALQNAMGWGAAFTALGIGPALGVSAMLLLMRRLRKRSSMTP